MEKLPPIEKIYEAYSALADQRVSMGEGTAAVTSSDGAKKYRVEWQDDNNSIFILLNQVFLKFFHGPGKTGLKPDSDPPDR